jgi:hypothetical protein
VNATFTIGRTPRKQAHASIAENCRHVTSVVHTYYTNVVSERARSSERQLGHLKETHNLLKAARIAHWLGGGWAIDFLVGRVTRQHSDVDFAIWKNDWRRVEALLLAHEFTLRANEFPEETGRLVHKGTNFEFYLLQKNAAR